MAVLTLTLAACASDTEPEPTTTSSSTTSSTPPASLPVDSSSTRSSSTTSTSTSTSLGTTTATQPTYSATIRDVTTEELAHSYRDDCPVAPDDLVAVELLHWGFDGQVHQGEIVVARNQGEEVAAIFGRLFELRYPIESIVPIGKLPQGIEDDDPDYNNTSGLHCRRATGSTRWSEHARGLAIDINPFQNPFVTSNILWPANSGRYRDRALGEPGMITAGDGVVDAFEDNGWLWGGHWQSLKDYQHFSVSGR